MAAIFVVTFFFIKGKLSAEIELHCYKPSLLLIMYKRV